MGRVPDPLRRWTEARFAQRDLIDEADDHPATVPPLMKRWVDAQLVAKEILDSEEVGQIPPVPTGIKRSVDTTIDANGIEPAAFDDVQITDARFTDA